jgi:undecaprenyl phosphate-alpha-L-ara4FN deformylase
MRRIALKIDVDTLRGTLEGVPTLARLLKEHRADGTFLFSLGPDHTGRALRRIFRRGFLSKVRRTSVGSHYGFKTLSYGVLLPGPDIAKHGGHIMRRVRDEGFEVGVHCYDHVLWQDKVAQREWNWTRQQMSLAVDAFHKVFDEAPKVHAAAGWQMNRFVPALEHEFGFDYASDTRGSEPFLPVAAGGESVCVQVPTTLPTFDELIGIDSCTPSNVDEIVFQRTTASPQNNHVFTLHAELEGMRLQDSFVRLLKRWRLAGYEVCSMRNVFEQVTRATVPRRAIGYETIQGRSGSLAVECSAVRT